MEGLARGVTAYARHCVITRLTACVVVIARFTAYTRHYPT